MRECTPSFLLILQRHIALQQNYIQLYTILKSMLTVHCYTATACANFKCAIIVVRSDAVKTGSTLAPNLANFVN